MMAFFLFTTFFVIVAWILFFYNLVTSKSKKSSVFGYLAIAYAFHALSSQMMGMDYLFYLIFSVIWMLFHMSYKRTENNSSDNDINKKEKGPNEL